MANFNGKARSNYVKLRPGMTVDDFERAIGLMGLSSLCLIKKVFGDLERDSWLGVGLYSDDGDTGCWPSFLYHDGDATEDDAEFLASCLTIGRADVNQLLMEATEGEYEFSWEEHIMPMIAEGEVFVIMEAGSEKIRYVTGYAQAYVRQGSSVRCVTVSLDDIYQKASSEFKVDMAKIQTSTY